MSVRCAGGRGWRDALELRREEGLAFSELRRLLYGEVVVEKYLEGWRMIMYRNHACNCRFEERNVKVLDTRFLLLKARDIGNSRHAGL